MLPYLSDNSSYDIVVLETYNLKYIIWSQYRKTKLHSFHLTWSALALFPPFLLATAGNVLSKHILGLIKKQLTQIEYKQKPNIY